VTCWRSALAVTCNMRSIRQNSTTSLQFSYQQQSHKWTSHYSHKHYIYNRPLDAELQQTRVSDCLDDVASWMAVNQLQLSHSQTEVLWCSSTRRQHQIPTITVQCWWHFCATGRYCLESQDLLGCWRHHALSCDCNCLCMLCYSAADQQHSTFTVTSSLADLASCTHHQQA